MEKIIDPVSKELLKAELTPDKKLRDTNKGGNEIYVVTWHDSPNVVTEIGRLREEAFRQAGGSTGFALDLDEYDKMENPYKQIVVWDPDAEAILGGYRYIFGTDVKFNEAGQPDMTSTHLFHYSDEFIDHYLPHVMELGRSFVAPEYQSSKAGPKAIFSLDNLWDGITAVILQHPNIMYFVGKMTMYPSYDATARNLILHFLWKHFGDKEELARPYDLLMPEGDPRLMDLILKDDDFKQDYRNLKDAVHKLGTAIPPLVNSYMSLSPTMKMFGTCRNDELAEVYETGIMVCFDEMFEDKKERHVRSFIRDNVRAMRERFPDLEEGLEEKLMERWYYRRQKVHGRWKLRLPKLRRNKKDDAEKTE